MSEAVAALPARQVYVPPEVNPWFIALTVTLATFMEVLDTSIANVSLPHIAGGLAAGVDESTWILTSYLVSNAIVLPMSGWFSSLIGRKRFYMSCVALFTISSFLCGLAPNLATLILFRVLQGAGGGGLQPSEQSILADTFSPEKRGMAFAVYGMAVVVAPAIGPTLGGFITDNYSWRWIFYINVPIGIISMLLTSRVIKDPPHLSGSRQRGGISIDYIGLGLLATGLGALQVILDKGQREDWLESHMILTLSIISTAALIAVIFWEWHHKNPIIDLKLFRDRSFAIGNSMMFMLGFILLGTTLLLPLFTQTMLGYTAEKAGLALMPGGLVILSSMPIVGFLLSRSDPRRIMIFGLCMLTGALFYMSHFNLYIDFQNAALARIIQGSGLACLFVPINTVAYSYLPPEKNNAASGLINLARNVGGSVGISFVTTMLARRQQFHRAQLSAHLNPANPRVQQMLQGASGALRSASGSEAMRQAYGLLQRMLERQSTMLSYIDNFHVLAIVTMAMIPFVFLIRKPRRRGGMVAH
ncbi:MAG: EmrB/QacA family drug resistance transporter [Acidobacteria bacterium]|nr:MAG: EmrB/QacA family drug resistance transporter [Acidobacteriota bacterium]